jgi:hypothetical protein
MNQNYRCPACHSDNVIDFGDYIHCPNCNLEFFKETFDKIIDEEDTLSEEELLGISNAFNNEFKDEKDRKNFLKSINRDCD